MDRWEESVLSVKTEENLEGNGKWVTMKERRM